MSNPDFTHITPTQYISLWDEYAKAALQGAIAFHGVHPSAAGAGAELVAQLADRMMELRQARVGAHKDQVEADQAKPTKPKPAR